MSKTHDMLHLLSFKLIIELSFDIVMNVLRLIKLNKIEVLINLQCTLASTLHND